MLNQILWILAAAAFSFAIPAIFSAWLKLPRPVYLVFYVGFSIPFLWAFFRGNNVNLGEIIKHNLVLGLIGAALIGFFLVKNIYSQPASAHSEGLGLFFDIFWLGIVYGLIDSLMLSVLPALAVWNMGIGSGISGKIISGVLVMLASVFVTATYHLGYIECRGGGLVPPTIGNSVMTLGYVLTENPLTASLSHITMHVAGVMRGPESVKQLPPHY